MGFCVFAFLPQGIIVSIHFPLIYGSQICGICHRASSFCKNNKVNYKVTGTRKSYKKMLNQIFDILIFYLALWVERQDFHSRYCHATKAKMFLYSYLFTNVQYANTQR